ncbi:hypothetical protein EZS27_017596, partial [termite gut metagenome]
QINPPSQKTGHPKRIKRIFEKMADFGGVVINNDLWNKFDICRGEDQGHNNLIEHFKWLKKARD